MTTSFPDGFTWGTATAAHQVEGNTTNNDWWDWEHRPDTVCAEPAGDACDQYHRYEADIALLAALGFDNYRFSLEWSRIEPEEGHISVAALDHYRRVCAACLAHGVTPVVTYHHFTTPRWAAAAGGWGDPAIVDRFARYCEVATEHLGDLIGRACTINEPNIVAFMGFVMGLFPPGATDLAQFEVAAEHFSLAHTRAVEAIRNVEPSLPCGITMAMADYQADPPDDPAAVRNRDDALRLMEDRFLERLEGDDFVGVQTYSRHRFGPDGMLGAEPGVEEVPHMGYEFWPEALEATIRHAAATTGLPVLVTENGLCTDDDARRVEYVRRALEGVLRCCDDGIEVRGYTYWSLLDNFEWAFGYAPRFGIVEVDRSTQRRTVKPSGEWLGRVAQANALVD
ncbi:MAG: family 1 glycosylhydrolase [Acidimicrobiia bacterium]|nr:family 1 glycosylhydrolase [Acidimicrobiia bacterium]